MFDSAAEDKDTENQVKKATPDTSDVESARREREGTPGPQEQQKSSAGEGTQIKAVADEPDNKDS